MQGGRLEIFGASEALLKSTVEVGTLHEQSAQGQAAYAWAAVLFGLLALLAYEKGRRGSLRAAVLGPVMFLLGLVVLLMVVRPLVRRIITPEQLAKLREDAAISQRIQDEDTAIWPSTPSESASEMFGRGNSFHCVR